MEDEREARRKANRGRAAGPENRLALLRAAREVFSETGLATPFSAVAKRAGVGQGSLYRHFPDRTALAAAIFEENVAAIEAHTAPEDRTIEDLFDVIVEQAVVSTALIDLTVRNRHDPHVVAVGVRFRELVDRLLVRERAAGRIGAHVETADVTLAVGMLAGELARTDESERAAVAARARKQFRRAFAS
ncbi:MULTISPECIES: TetR/AcrR family transcriptional regulator [unclassified Microbacterium]|uniref:TetR/AcrR family transcriptional regulator n=1 Tax=unclassified Microbacterium TaxID=2609290 RepID=UPI00214D0A96|nr:MULTISPECIES: TetR/AcrR family transcriptional regulator [unclassified Microbacterium]MCR2783450.1 TetR/AcrR family transcriptional regulator [Microbacterium sp. zg.B96]MDL5351763.1 helix-turn-helix domain-containing protein [Microbacterium sp. zg-YB36]